MAGRERDNPTSALKRIPIALYTQNHPMKEWRNGGWLPTPSHTTLWIRETLSYTSSLSL